MSSNQPRRFGAYCQRRMVTYATGHGDFAFGRVCDQPFDRSGEIPVWRYYQGDRTFSEFKEFARSGHFPYEKLPLEIRFRILKLLIAPFYHYNPNIKKSYIRVELAQFIRKHAEDKLYLQSYQKFLRACHTNERCYSQRGRLDGELMFLDRRATHLMRKKGHPNRSTKYNFKAVGTSSYTLAPGSTSLQIHNTLDLEEYKHLRDLSNVSCRFRLELGTLFWTRVTMPFKHLDDCMLLPKFLNERPSVVQGIRTISLEADCTRCDKENGQNFTRIISYIGDHLDLEVFQLGMTINESMMKRFVERKCITGDPEWLLQCKKLNVTRTFLLKETSIKALLKFEKGNEASVEYTDRLCKEWFPLIRKLILPHCLDDQGEETNNLKGVQTLLGSLG